MKGLLIFMVLALTIHGYSQSNAEKVEAILIELGANDKNHKVTIYQETPLGIFFTIQTIKAFEVELNEQVYHGYFTESFDTYCKINDSISSIPLLKDYINYGYAVSKQAFITGRYDVNSLTAPQVEEVYKYDLKSKELITQGVFADGVYGARVVKDNMSLLLSVKSVDGVGSNLIYTSFPIK